MSTFETEFRLRQVAEGVSPWAVLDAKPVTLTEAPLQGVKMMRDWSHKDASEHRYVLYHPEHGMIGGVTLEPHAGGTMDQAKKAKMTITSLDNPDVPSDHYRKDPKTGNALHTSMGPVYDLGTSQVMKLLRGHFKQRYPDLERIEAQRVTGVRADQANHGGPAQLNLRRGAGPLRATGASSSRPSPSTPGGHPAFQGGHPDGSHEMNQNVLQHHDWELYGTAQDGWTRHESSSHQGHSVHSNPRTGQWMHLDQDGAVIGEGGTSRELDHHIHTLHYGSDVKYFSGSDPHRSAGVDYGEFNSHDYYHTVGRSAYQHVFHELEHQRGFERTHEGSTSEPSKWVYSHDNGSKLHLRLHNDGRERGEWEMIQHRHTGEPITSTHRFFDNSEHMMRYVDDEIGFEPSSSWKAPHTGLHDPIMRLNHSSGHLDPGMSRSLERHGFQKVASPHDGSWEHWEHPLHPGHRIVVDKNQHNWPQAWHTVHGGSGVTYPRSRMGLGDLDAHLQDHFTSETSARHIHDLLGAHGFDKVPGVDSAIFGRGSSVWKRGSHHIHVANPGQIAGTVHHADADTRHWVYRQPGNDAASAHGKSHQLGSFIQDLSMEESVTESSMTLQEAWQYWIDDIVQDAFDMGFKQKTGMKDKQGQELHQFEHPESGHVLTLTHGPKPQDSQWEIHDHTGKLLHRSSFQKDQDLFLDRFAPGGEITPPKDSLGRVKAGFSVPASSKLKYAVEQVANGTDTYKALESLLK